MLLCRPRRPSALHIPVALGLLSVLILVVSIAELVEELSWGNAFFVLFGVIVPALTLSQLRRIRVQGEFLVVETPYTRDSLPLSELSLGTSVQRGSKGGRTYTVHAIAGSHKVPLVEAMSERGATKLKARLAQTFLDGRPASEALESNQHRAQEMETKWKTQDREAQAIVNQYYGEGGPSRTLLYAAVVFVVVSVLVGALIGFSKQ